MATTEYFHGTRVFKAGDEPRPIAVEDYSTIGAVIVAPNADPDVWPENEPVVLFSNEKDKITALGTGGNVDAVFDAINDQTDEEFVAAEIVAVRVPEGTGATDQEKLEATMANIVGAAAASTGVHAFLQASRRAKLLIAPGYTSQRIGNGKNPVMAELDSVARRLRGIKIGDAPATTRDAALEYREDFADDARAYLVSPGVLVTGADGKPVFQPASGRVAGLFVRRDKNVGGPHMSPSNQAMGGIVGTSRPVSYYDGEPDSEANLLNQNRIATIIENGILWGNETCAADPLERFVNVVRTNDMIDGAVVKAFRWAIASNISVPLASAIIQSLDEFLAEASAKGQIINGRCWFERPLNPNSNLVSGILRLEYDREPYAPLQDLQFGARRNVGYYDQVADGIVRAVEQINASTIALTYGINTSLTGA
jgi:phage tail sheath protein FI